MDGREWDDKAEALAVCEGVSFGCGEGDGDGVWIERKCMGQPRGCLWLCEVCARKINWDGNVLEKTV